LDFEKKLYWIIFVGDNTRKIYDAVNGMSDEENETVPNVKMSNTMAELLSLKELFNEYKSNSLNEFGNKYKDFSKKLIPYFTPFEYISPEIQESIILEKSVETNIHTIIDNLSDLYSSVYSKNQILNAVNHDIKNPIISCIFNTEKIIQNL
jgi:hypothetical protein